MAAEPFTTGTALHGKDKWGDPMYYIRGRKFSMLEMLTLLGMDVLTPEMVRGAVGGEHPTLRRMKDRTWEFGPARLDFNTVCQLVGAEVLTVEEMQRSLDVDTPF